MRINDAKKGDGPAVTDRFNRGDSWAALDGPHVDCKGGKARQVVQGTGLKRIERPPSQAHLVEGILMRCSGCLGSYVLTQQD